MWRISGLTRDGTSEPVSRDQILRRERGPGNIHFLCSADDHEQDWQPYPVDPYSAICDDHIIGMLCVNSIITTSSVMYVDMYVYCINLYQSSFFIMTPITPKLLFQEKSERI